MAMKTPGVYIVEKSAFPNSVVQVATAVPAFIGYTETAMNGNDPLHQRPWRITSMADYHRFFGGAPKPKFQIVPFAERSGTKRTDRAGANLEPELPQAVFTASGPTGPEKFELQQVNKAFALYGAMRLFFLNGGGACYVTSIGTYEGDEIDSSAMEKAIERLKKEPEPTMIVIPETTRLTRQNSNVVQGAMLAHCGQDMKNRFAILDIFQGYLAQDSERGDPVATFRNDAGINNLDFAAAYYPWLDTAVFQSRDFNFENIDFDSRRTFIGLLKRSVNNDTNLLPEIERVGRPELAGDFTISLTAGSTVKITETDISARDESTHASRLKYEVDGDEEGMRGKLVKDGSADPITEFNQQDLDNELISFVHTGTDSKPGSFKVKVIDEDAGIATASHKIDVVIGNQVMALADVQGGDATVEVDVVKDHAGGKPESVMLVEADGVDPATAIENDADAKNAKEAAEANDATDEQKETAKTEAQRAVREATGKTKTVPEVGTWTVAKTGKITFAPVKDFDGTEAKVSYTIETDDGKKSGEISVLLDGVVEESKDEDPSIETIDKTMRAVVPLYTEVMNTITAYVNAMPPAAAMAGIYTAVDNSRGVWKAPANVSVSGVVGPMVNIDHFEQENLNVSTTGKSINAIRPFVGEGTLVWGARTLDGNSLDWRYINVRRTMIMIEESIRLAAKAYVFEPNTANTWVTMRSMIENFLTSVWKQGGLAGTVPADAFSVHVGLGETMTPVDILEGKLLITVLVAVVRPAEFIEITFQQQMQKS